MCKCIQGDGGFHKPLTHYVVHVHFCLSHQIDLSVNKEHSLSHDPMPFVIIERPQAAEATYCAFKESTSLQKYYITFTALKTTTKTTTTNN